MKNIFVCFYGDGELWQNINEVVSYPSGCTFYRDFRYRDKKVQASILADIKNKDQRMKFQGKKGILAIRFFSEKFQSLLLPVREIEINHINYLPDNQSVSFTFGRMIDFTQSLDLRSLSLEIPSDETKTISRIIFYLNLL